MSPEEKRERERLAREAQRLTNDEVLIKALEGIRKNAVDALIKADPNNAASVIRFQAKITVCDEFMAELGTMISLQSIENRSRIS